MANFVTDNYKLDITPQGSYPVVYMSQFEDGRQIRFRILNRGMSYTIPSGISAFVSVFRLLWGCLRVFLLSVCLSSDTYCREC